MISSSSLVYLFLAYGAFWFIPTALLVIILLRVNRLHREVEALRRQIGPHGADRPSAQAGDAEQA